ncbi:MAG: NTP transferase domain-containing protein [Gammaproteobacteria bacterium]
MSTVEPGFVAIVLAGDRRADDPLVIASGRGCKALLEIAGRPMLLRVLDAVRGCPGIVKLRLSGPPAASIPSVPELQQLLDSAALDWQPPGPTPSTSAGEAMRDLPPDLPVVLTTGDHALLLPEYLGHFIAAARASGADAVVGLAEYSRVREIFPTMPKTLLRFREGDFCGCNLFAFMTPRSRELATLWRRVEGARKTPWRVLGLLGWWNVIRYRLGWLGLDQAMALLSRRTGLRIAAIRMPFGEVAVDVDTLLDHAEVERRLLLRENRA